MQVQKIGADTDKAPNRPAALLVTTVGSFLTPFLGSSLAIALPTIGKKLLMNAVMLGLVPTAYLLAAAMFLVPLGRIADIYGRKRIFTYGRLNYAVHSGFLAISTSAN